jgi:hypothetical protein
MKRKRQQKAREKRRDKRVGAALPVDVGPATGITRDVSASGMYFETDASYSVGSPVNIALSLDTPWGKVMFRCDGKIVRVESHDRKVGVAVQFIESKLDARQRARKRRAA